MMKLKIIRINGDKSMHQRLEHFVVSIKNGLAHHAKTLPLSEI